MFTVTAVPAFRDNYIWVLHRDHMAVLVDPGEAEAILPWLEVQGMRPVAVLITHHHRDHVGALPALCARWSMPVYGPAREAIAHVSQGVDEGERIAIPELGAEFQVLATPGHTLGHVCYHGQGRLFSGDTLFSCGCGRLFEGSAAQMHASLMRLAGLPGETLMHCAHEYTLPNIGFAQEVEPDNAALQARYAEARQMRRQRLPTLPVTLATEIATNPFLRCGLASLQNAVSRECGETLNDPIQTFAALRAWKDAY